VLGGVWDICTSAHLHARDERVPPIEQRLGASRGWEGTKRRNSYPLFLEAALLGMFKFRKTGFEMDSKPYRGLSVEKPGVEAAPRKTI
jgi:hypothetical protein